MVWTRGPLEGLQFSLWLQGTENELLVSQRGSRKNRGLRDVMALSSGVNLERDRGHWILDIWIYLKVESTGLPDRSDVGMRDRIVSKMSLRY